MAEPTLVGDDSVRDNRIVFFQPRKRIIGKTANLIFFFRFDFISIPSWRSFISSSFNGISRNPKQCQFVATNPVICECVFITVVDDIVAAILLYACIWWVRQTQHNYSGWSSLLNSGTAGNMPPVLGLFRQFKRKGPQIISNFRAYVI